MRSDGKELGPEAISIRQKLPSRPVFPAHQQRQITRAINLRQPCVPRVLACRLN